MERMPAQAASSAPAASTTEKTKRMLVLMPPGLYCLFLWSEIK
jgi:hypothetical protein